MFWDKRQHEQHRKVLQPKCCSKTIAAIALRMESETTTLHPSSLSHKFSVAWSVPRFRAGFVYKQTILMKRMSARLTDLLF